MFEHQIQMQKLYLCGKSTYKLFAFVQDPKLDSLRMQCLLSFVTLKKCNRSAQIRNKHAREKTHEVNIYYYYLFKKFLVSDWLTANCEIVINSMANKIRIFHIHISKMTSKSQYEKNLDAFAPYYYDDENHIDSLTPLI